ncbi:MAG: histidine phosphatase family protein, partial [Spirochaetota bacterium]
FHTLPHPCRFYFVRHGESEGNASARIQGHTDSPLSELGRSHAEAAGRWLADKDVDLVLSSPLSRARETAAAIARHTGARGPDAVPELIELDTGLLSGTRIDDLKRDDPELYAQFRVRSWEAIPDAEPIASLRARARAAWDRLIALARGGARTIVSVSHGGTIQWLIKSTIGSDEQQWMPLFPASNCGIFLFRAESTLGSNEAGAHVPGSGYYGAWVHVNHVPY